jgi:puromycin-sensitive aminopeptidase
VLNPPCGRAAIVMCFVVSLAVPDAGFAQRLPGAVTPKHYTLRFTPDLTAATFTGTARIDVDVATPTSQVVLNALDLTLSEVRITQAGATRNAQVAMHPERQQAELTLSDPLVAGPAMIELSFAGALSKQLAGFYLGTKGEHRYAASQLQATDARRMFPSFDEPALKAAFDISAVVDQKHVAISNGRQISDVPGPAAGQHTVTFATTPRMSTYLVALLVGEFTCASGAVGDIPLRVCALPGQEAMTSFALEATKGVLNFYGRYYEIKYPFDKLDQIGIPDFGAGAMENSGAIVYRESLLLVDSANTTIEQQRLVAEVIAHEIAHQWFGNLVTMKWWDDIWLNEGFATWMSGKALDAWKPEWRTEESFQMGYPFWIDSFANTRPIHASAETPEEILQLFDGIAYQKTAAVLRMVENYIGAEDFRRGVNSYLAKHQYANAGADDFARAIAEASKQPVDQTLKDFVRQPGLPLLTVTPTCDGQLTRIAIKQQRFFFDPKRLDAESPERWSVPMCLRALDDAPVCRMITREQQTIELPGCHQPLVANAQANGYYRTAYSPEAAEGIAKAPSVRDDERALFFADQWALVVAGRMDIGPFLDWVSAQRPRIGRFTLDELFYTLRAIREDILSPGDRAAFEQWARTLVQTPLVELGLATRTNDSDEQKKYRSTLVRFASEVAREPEVVAKLIALATAYMSGSKNVDPALVDPALGAVTKSGDPTMYDRFVSLSDSSANPLDRDRYVYSLSAFENEALVKRALDYALSPQSRAQDVGGLVLTAFQNPAGRRAAWEFLKPNYDALTAKVGPVLGGSAVSVVGTACEPDLIADMERFFTEKKVPGTVRILQDGLERARICVSLKERQQGALHRWLARRPNSSQ